MKKFATRFAAATLAGIVALAPMAASAAELKSTEYNTEVTKSDGTLKAGYHETQDSSKTWWKTETYYTDWQEVDEATYNAKKEADLKYMDDSGRTDWRVVDRDTYLKYKQDAPDDAKTDGYTDYAPCDKATYDNAADDMRKRETTEFETCDKAAYDAVTDPDLKLTYKTDWQAFADPSDWAEKYDAWLQYAEDSRRVSGASDFYEVDEATYLAFAAKFPGFDGQLFKYEDITYSQTAFENWPYFDYQIITNTYNAAAGHDPFFILVGEFNQSGYYQGCSGGNWNGQNNGLTYLNESNGTSAQNIAEGTMDIINKYSIPYVNVSSSSDLPFNCGNQKYNEHVNDGIHNASNEGGNGFIDIVDQDFKIYYYDGTGTLSLNGFYGILIAPHATVDVAGKWIGTIIADTVNNTNGGGESTAWTYPIDKGTVERRFYIANPSLEVKEDVYMIRSYNYFVRDNIYKVRDVVKKYYVRDLDQKIYYCETSPYIPQTGDISFGILISIVAGVVVLGGVLIFASKKKNSCK